MKRLLLIGLPLLLIVGCSKPVEDSTLINKDGLMYLPDSDSPYSGEVFINYSTGEKLYQGTYENGLLIEYSYLNKDGSVKEPINYKETLNERDGVFYTKDTNKPYSGQVFSLYDDGKKKEEGIFKDGKKEGLWTSWYENGQKWFEKNYKDGKDDELWTYWDKNDGKMYNGKFINTNDKEIDTDSLNGRYFGYYDGIELFNVNYKDGKKGLETIWYESGQKKEERDKYGEGYWTTWYENGQKFRELTYKDGQLDGLFTHWYENGQKSYESTYKDGKKEGLYTHWYDNGRKDFEEKYQDGDYVGKYKYVYYPNGEKKRDSFNKNNVRDGEVIWWYRGGQKQMLMNWVSGKLISKKCWDKNGNEKECD